MSRPLRTVLILLAMGVAATVALGVLAGRLRTRVAAPSAPARQVVPAQADRLTPEGEARLLVARFLEVRRAVARGTGESVAREEAGLGEGEYVRVREAYRAWRGGSEVSDPPLRRALEGRREELRSLPP